MERSYLRLLRQQRGQTQREVAAAIGITRQYYQMIEAGVRQVRINAVLAARLAGVFGVALDWILQNECPAEYTLACTRVSESLSDNLDTNGKESIYAAIGTEADPF